MHPETGVPAFEDFLRFVATHYAPARAAALPGNRIVAAARNTHRDLRTAMPLVAAVRGQFGTEDGCLETLQALAASSGDGTQPADLVTARGFRVRLDYREGTEAEPPSICVLVQCPSHWIAGVQGRVAYLWSGAERFELGEFDADGKAIGTLPAGIEITLHDFVTGKVKLEAPEAATPDSPG